MVFIGIGVVLAGVMSSSGSTVSGGGFILIGPIPILFGSGPDSTTLSVVGAVITIAVVVIYLMSVLRWKRYR